MNFSNQICDRPDNEEPHLFLVCGYPTSDAKIPAAGARKKSLDDISSWI